MVSLDNAPQGPIIHFDVLSAFHPCGRDLVKFFNSTDRTFYVKVRWRRLSQEPVSWNAVARV